MKYPSYSYPVESLYTGASFGNRHTFARFDAETNLRGLWSATDDRYYAGEWRTEIFADGRPLKAKETVFSPESQKTLFAGDHCTAGKTCFIPFHTGTGTQTRLRRAGLCLLHLHNRSSDPTEIVVRHTIYFPASHSNLFVKQPSKDQTAKKVVIRQNEYTCEITTRDRPDEVRVFGASIPWCRCTGNDTTLETEYRIALEAGNQANLQFVLSFSPDGINEAMEDFNGCRDARKILDESIMQYREILSSSFIMTPDPVINRGLQWAKINTVRVQHQYRTGEGFTNDPPQDIVVIRDLAWYVLGSDYLTPEFSRGLLDLASNYGFHEGGKLTEYFHADEEHPVQHDYHLNINDDTPLYVYALYHHAVTCGDDFERIYPLMKRACDWILSQLSNGLVRCRADGTNVWGICGWRNIIDNYTLTGAVTEINSECYYAIKLTADVAGYLRKEPDSEYYRAAAEHLKTAINKELLSERTGMYLLNLDNKGVRHHDVTGDLIFPVMFGVAGDAVRSRILEKLTDGDMWTPYGSRTVSRLEANYDPDFGYQLVGGLWHNLTAWVAYCIREEQPEKLIEGMQNIYRLCEVERPADFVNVVPGQFPERIHGESFISRGMTMSPWMPPTYLWLGVEGLLGVKATLDGLEMNPALPPEWRWISVKSLPYKGQAIDAFFHEGTLYSTDNMQTSYPLKVGTSIEVLSDNDAIIPVGIKVGNELILFVASDCDAAGTITVASNGSQLKQEIFLHAGEGRLLRVSEMHSINQ